MHPQIVALAAAEHVKDMLAAANRGRRVREARRARRGAIANNSAVYRDQSAAQDSWPWLSNPPLYARAA